jgi:DNA primase
VGIVDEDIERTRDAADFVQIVGEVAQLRKVGRSWVGLCPFHSEKSPSFSVNAEQKLYYCYGCQAGGNLFRFVQETQHLDFAGAVEWVAGKYGIQLRYDDERKGQDRARRQVLTEAMERAVAWYHERLLTSPDAGAARGYLRSRGYDRAIVERFRIGWAPDDWDALAKALSVPHDVLEDTGLGFVNRRNKLQDSFRARVMFPIFDAAGKPVAFGGRILPGAEGPKYKNSAETKLYSKSRTLYALNWAKEEVSRIDEVIVCEGYTDVIAFFTAGMPRAVATCGTALAASGAVSRRSWYQSTASPMSFDIWPRCLRPSPASRSS